MNRINLNAEQRMRLRFAIGGGLSQRVIKDDKEMTLEEIAFVLGVSKERVRQIEMEAMKKLRGFGLKIEDFI